MRNFKTESIQIAFLAIIALVVHAVVLKFVFPGYYSPLYPHHSDFYIPVALAHSPHDFFQYSYLGYSRPLGIFFLKGIGMLGIHGAILFTIINVAINASLSATIFRIVTKVPFKVSFLIAFCLYVYSLFSQPYFYTFYSQDVLSHLSYLFLLTGIYLYLNYHQQSRFWAGSLLFLCCVIGFLCKETYGLTFPFILFAGFLYIQKELGIKTIIPFLLISLSLVLALCFNVLIKSVFIDFENSSTSSPYYISLNPISIWNELFIYCKEGLNFINAAILILIGFRLYFIRQSNPSYLYIYSICLLAAFLSWIPNSLIPNHHYGGYSFNGAYILYLPLFFIPIFWNQENISRSISILFISGILISPFFNKKEYEKNGWILEQESNQRNLLQSLDTLIPQLKPSVFGNKKNILISGLTMPFYPFHHPLALHYYPHSKFVNFDIVNYSKDSKISGPISVRLVPVSTIESIDKYSSVWLFAGDGKFIRALALDSLSKETIRKNKALDLILHPDYLKNKELSLLLNNSKGN